MFVINDHFAFFMCQFERHLSTGKCIRPFRSCLRGRLKGWGRWLSPFICCPWIRSYSTFNLTLSLSDINILRPWGSTSTFYKQTRFFVCPQIGDQAHSDEKPSDSQPVNCMSNEDLDQSLRMHQIISAFAGAETSRGRYASVQGLFGSQF